VEHDNPFFQHRVQIGFLVSHRTRLARHSRHPLRDRVFTGPARSAAFLRGMQRTMLTWPDRVKDSLSDESNVKPGSTLEETGDVML